MTTTDLQAQWQRLVEAGKLQWHDGMATSNCIRVWDTEGPHVEGVDFRGQASRVEPSDCPDFADPATEGVIARQARKALADPSAFVGSICTDDGTLTGWIAYGRTKKYGPELTDTIGGPAATRVGAWMNAVEGR